MGRKAPNVETLKFLYVRSGNECAFPDCNHPIFNDDGLYIAELCHIKAANKGGPRYDNNQSNEERRSPENLLFMCHRHHKETDNEEVYTVEHLKNIKTSHELRFSEEGRACDKEMLQQILSEVKFFWGKLQTREYEFDDLKIKRDLDKDIFALLSELKNQIQSISEYCELCAESDESERLNDDLKFLLAKVGLPDSTFDKVPYYENLAITPKWKEDSLHTL